ncbi:penicillin-binding protein 1B [Nitrincola tibetensis]|uniref:Penicillin-binding protein 1B n=1 Tax=Nitrincola tibetensis TaxID=2219697 RepID=A0A364NHU3_9GAMM|nr:penicillin-binding protein 1B [Nitrincola tibetensis]RAU16614.1 penicillin-binding protein 1B [Nitrincola tibetensis]
MSKKRVKTTRRRGQNQKKSTGSAIFKWIFAAFLKLSILGAVFFAVVLIYVDGQVREKFEGKRWALPAKVYARPLELYPGQSISIQDLREELTGLGYRFVSAAQGPGNVEVANNRVRVITRGFDFPDGAEPQRRLMLEFSGERLQRLYDEARNETLPLVRMEPIQIGGIYPHSNEDRDLIRIEEAPPFLKEALLVVEDRDYYSHHGISIKGISRALWVNIQAGRFVQGGSTLTQQLIKNFYLTSDRTLSRKLLELPMALVMDFRYEKDEILEAYLNEVYLGQSGTRAVHGFGLASQFYFSRPVTELELHQVALLVAMVKGPSFYDPRRNPERALQRRNLVLSMLRDHGHISDAQFQEVAALPLGIAQARSLHKGAYPAYLDLVRRQLRKDYRDEDLSSEGLLIFTALDPLAQSRADQSMVTVLNDLEKRHGARGNDLQGAMVVTDPQTGEVLAVVGGKDTRYEGFNRGLDAVRPIGSLAKPAIYLAALEQGYTLASVLQDTAINMRLPNGDVWTPQNFDRQIYGSVLMHRALARSLNLSTVNLGMEIGLPKVVDVLKRLGVERDIQLFPSMLLGAQGMSPIEVAEMYQTFASNGFRMPLRSIRMVTTAEGEELSRYPFQLRQQVDAAYVHLIQYAMQEVAREGTARSIYQRLPTSLNVAGKTGTSSDQRDSWFAGYAGNRLAVVWVGRDDNSQLPFTSTGGALPVWIEFMARDKPEPLVAARPSGIEYVWIDEETGLRSDPLCQGSRQLPFITGSAPQLSVDCGQHPSVNTPTPVEPSSGWLRNWFR